MSNKLKVLLIIEQCNPEWSSVPLEGYNYYQEISQIVDATLVTHERNKVALQKNFPNNKIIYIDEDILVKQYYNIVARLTFINRINWPLYNTLTYPVFAAFNHKVYEKFKTQVLKGDYDIVHVLTPMMPRYPAKIIKACKDVPFILGPVNGGVPFPKGFRKIAQQEFAQFNFLRAFGRILIPGYVETYKKADKVLAGSTYTLNLLKKLFAISDNKINLFYENGITKNFFQESKKVTKYEIINLLFVGRLVPYKGADMLIEAISNLTDDIKNKIKLTIVGDGSERNSLEAKVKKFNLENKVIFTGWLPQKEIIKYYQNSDIFCFPSIREFGGAVVLEAMACGLPCIVANNGGIGEYVTEETGFKIEPISRDYLTKELTNKIQILIENYELRQKMSLNSVERVKQFEWGTKAQKIVEIYQEMIAKKKYSLANVHL